MPALHYTTADLLPDFTNTYLDRGRYFFVEQLGKGGQGAVYLAQERDPETNKLVSRAIKVMYYGGPRSPLRATVYREAELHQMVNGHPNVVPLHRVLWDTQYAYFIMDFCDGGDLWHLQNSRTLSRNDARLREVFLQIIEAVAGCHSKGVYHRDLKPENILVHGDRVFLADFGLSTRNKMSIAFNTGTEAFMSPECIGIHKNEHPYDTSRNDIWALGVMLVDIVTGHMPWDTATRTDKLFVALEHEPLFLRAAFPISESLNDLLRRVFDLSPHGVISIDEFKESIRTMETFYMTEEEIAASNDVVQFMWESYRPSGARKPVHFSSSDTIETAPSELSCAPTINSEKACSSGSCKREEEQDPLAQTALDAENGRSSYAINSEDFGIRPPSSRSSRSSESEDDAPVTPKTHAQDPAGVVEAEPLDGSPGYELVNAIAVQVPEAKAGEGRLSIQKLDICC